MSRYHRHVGTLAEEGWEYVRRLSERPPVPFEEMTPEDEERWLGDAPGPEVWADLPVTRWPDPAQLPETRVAIVDSSWRADYPATRKWNHRHVDGTTVAHESGRGLC